MTPPSPQFSDDLNTTFAAISDATRRSILKQLSQGETTVNDVAQPFEMSLPAVSKHIRVLEKAGLVNRRRQGTTHFLSLNPDPLQRAADWFEYYKQFWTRQFDQLEQFLSTLNEKET